MSVALAYRYWFARLYTWLARTHGMSDLPALNATLLLALTTWILCCGVVLWMCRLTGTPSERIFEDYRELAIGSVLPLSFLLYWALACEPRRSRAIGEFTGIGPRLRRRLDAAGLAFLLISVGTFYSAATAT